ncbi:MAG: polysulfide reductase NrfD [Woeseiaceae bacterium]|nr:polysulfide reductase NrfD [Gammaproteobacteria bacterium]NNF48493.1 polysulfide reductase NrfD [Woeseiaceae bacterium]NNK24153.1 polysulfide reductase NrfD [Woeseiaceae bacterium]
MEELLVTARSNELIDPGLHIWTWEVAMYLFLGGLTAGVMVFAAVMALLRKDEEAPFAATQLALLAPIVLSAGMTTLFLDLEHKLYVFRFYTAFQPTSPMSWGAWILLLIYPVATLQILSTLRAGFPVTTPWVDRWAITKAIVDWCEEHRRQIAMVAVPSGVALGIYTGILLSAFSARPFWNTGVLGPLFLVSGLSTAAALVALLSKHEGEKEMFTRIDLGLIAAEIALVGLFLINLATGSAQHIEALHAVTGGPYTMVFWVLFVGIGLIIPLLLEMLEIRGIGKSIAVVAPVLVLIGGYALRQVMLDVGQDSTWTRYESQYSAEILERME